MNTFTTNINLHDLQIVFIFRYLHLELPRHVFVLVVLQHFDGLDERLPHRAGDVVVRDLHRPRRLQVELATIGSCLGLYCYSYRVPETNICRKRSILIHFVNINAKAFL